MSPIILPALLLLMIGSITAITFSGCFVFPPQFGRPDLSRFGWSDPWEVSSSIFNLQLCINHCVMQKVDYAAVEQSDQSKVKCYCGTESSLAKLGAPLHTDPKMDCNSAGTALKAYRAIDDSSSLRVGCFKENPSDPASPHHEWRDGWGMSISLCIQYCEANGEAYASLRNGDTCTCGISFAKHGVSLTCDVPCAGSAGEMCGGRDSISVYSTLSIDPTNQIITHLFQRPNAASIPRTQELIKSVLELNKAASGGQIGKKAEQVVMAINHVIFAASAVTGLRDDVEALNKAGPFTFLASPMLAPWLADRAKLPARLQPLMLKIQQAADFVSQDVAAALSKYDAFKSSMNDLNTVIQSGKVTLHNYFSNGRLVESIDRTLKMALKMVSAGTYCVPYLPTAQRTQLTKTLEDVSEAILNGQYGTKNYEQNVQAVETRLKAQSTSQPPTQEEMSGAKANIQLVMSAWSQFFDDHARHLHGLTITMYKVPDPSCLSGAVGKRQISNCTDVDISFSDLVKQAGDNSAKFDMEKFLQAEEVPFSAFNWDSQKQKFGAAVSLLTRTQEYMKQKGISSAADMSKLVDQLTSFKFYQTCVSQMEDVLLAVCHRTNQPDHTKFQTVTC